MALWLGILLSVVLIGQAAAPGWNNDYTDPTGDVFGGDYANVDITRLKSTESGADVVLEMTVRGTIESSTDADYTMWIGTQGSANVASWSDGTGTAYPSGTVTVVGGNTLRATMPKGTFSASTFDVIALASHTLGSSDHWDLAGAAYGGGLGGPVGGGGLFGNWWLWVLIPLVIIIVVIVLVVVLVMRKKPAAPAGPPPPMAPMPGQPYAPPPGQPYYPQAPPPQQYPPPPPGQPPARPPGT